jgi:hypothetical protein
MRPLGGHVRSGTPSQENAADAEIPAPRPLPLVGRRLTDASACKLASSSAQMVGTIEPGDAPSASTAALHAAPTPEPQKGRSAAGENTQRLFL